MDADFMSMDEMYDLIWADAGLELSEDVRAKIVAEDMASFLEGSRNLATLEWMRDLKARGLKIGILSNMSTTMAARFREVFADYIALADAMVISGEERMFKPQRRIYELLRSRLGRPAGELCFIDDVEANCDGARRAGGAQSGSRPSNRRRATLPRLPACDGKPVFSRFAGRGAFRADGRRRGAPPPEAAR